MTRLTLFTIALVVFLGGGLLAVFLILSNFERLADEDFVAETDPGYVAIDRFAAPVSVGRDLDHYVLIDLRLELADENRVLEVTAVLPRIRDLIVRDLHNNPGARADGITSIDLTRLRASALVLANRILGEGSVKAVLISRVAQIV